MQRVLPWMAVAALTPVLALADTQDFVRKSIPADGVRHLKLEMDFGAIQVDPGLSGKVEIEVEFRGTPPSRNAFDRMLRDFHLEANRTGDTLRVEGTFQDGWQPGSRGWRNVCHDGRCLEYAHWLRSMTARVRVPEQFSTDLQTRGGAITVGDRKGEVTARTSGGALRFGRIEAPVRGDTAGGAISLEASKGPAVLRTAGGAIRIQEVSGDVDAHTSGGPIQIERTTGRVIAHTSGGSIHIGQARGEVDASTSGGSIDVAMIRTAAFTLDASTSAGGVSSEFPVQGTSSRRSLRGPVNGGGPAVHLRTSGGSIHIRRA